jgi:hypothetical protein
MNVLRGTFICAGRGNHARHGDRMGFVNFATETSTKVNDLRRNVGVMCHFV